MNYPDLSKHGLKATPNHVYNCVEYTLSESNIVLMILLFSNQVDKYNIIIARKFKTKDGPSRSLNNSLSSHFLNISLDEINSNIDHLIKLMHMFDETDMIKIYEGQISNI